jgi:hypothetical protein
VAAARAAGLLPERFTAHLQGAVSLQESVQRLVNTGLRLNEPETSAALYAVAAELGGAAFVQRLTRRTQQVLAHTLAGASDGPPLDAGLAAAG